MILAASMLLGGCGSAQKEATQTTAAETILETDTEAAEETKGTETAAVETQMVETTAADETAETQKQEAAGEETAQEIPEEELIADELPVGDFVLEPVEMEADELTPEEQKEVDRAIRAYKAPANSLVKNDAHRYVCYDHLNTKGKEIYEAIQYAVEDPEKATSTGTYFTTELPGSDSFWKEFNQAYYAVLYDHPELFWLYNECDTNIWIRNSIKPVKGKYTIYLSLGKPVSGYAAKQTAFNNAVQKFLAGIDRSKSNDEIIRQIHDKLTDLVTYDYNVCNNNLRSNYAHTAYGALVANSEGKANYAVCDGYALAFTYLLQQCHLESMVVLGNAGSSMTSLGGHAWSLAKIGGKWREVDVCWDDIGTKEDKNQPSGKWYNYYKEMYSNAKMREKISHYMYNVSTTQITHFVPGSDYDYLTKDKKWILHPLSESYHVRDTDGYYGKYMELVPKAN